MSNKQCGYVKKDGTQCQAYAVNEKDYCFSHEPSLQEAKREASVKGGKHCNDPLGPVVIKNLGDIPRVIEETINCVRAKQLSAKEANAITRLLSTYTRYHGIK